MDTIQQRLEVALRTNDAKVIRARLFHLGFFNKCYKCDGQKTIMGFSHVANGVCFACGGAGGKVKKITKELIGEVEARVAAGKLDEILESFRAKKVALRAIKPLLEKITTEWRTGAIHTQYESFHKQNVEAAVVVETECFKYAGKINNLWGDANMVVSQVQARKLAAQEALVVLEYIYQGIQEMNAEYANSNTI